MTPRTQHLALARCLFTAVAVSISMVLAGLVTWLPGCGNAWVFVGATLVLCVGAGLPVSVLLDRAGARWDRQEGQR